MSTAPFALAAATLAILCLTGTALAGPLRLTPPWEDALVVLTGVLTAMAVALSPDA